MRATWVLLGGVLLAAPRCGGDSGPAEAGGPGVPIDAAAPADGPAPVLDAAPLPFDGPAAAPQPDAAVVEQDAATVDAHLEAAPAPEPDASPDSSADLPEPPPEAIEVTSACAIPPVAMPPAIQLALDVEYYAPGGQSQRLDVAWPAGAGPHPYVVLVHGGGWSAGDKLQHRQAIHRLAGAGYVAASINYRLAPSHRFPAAVQDVRCALRWLRAQTAYGLDPARGAVIGTSAGAHLAGMLATVASPTLDSGECPFTTPAPLKGAVGYYGIYDLRLPALLPGRQVAVFLGTTDPAVVELASPALHVDPGDPPMLLVHGTSDAMAPVWTSQMMKTALQSARVPATLVELPGAPHGFDVFDPAHPSAACTTLAFLAKYLRP